MPLHVSSTCAHHQEVKIALHSLWERHEIKLIVKQILCINLVKYWDKCTEMHGQPNVKRSCLLPWLKIFVIFLGPPMQTTWLCFTSGHNRFLPHTFRFITYHSSHRVTMNGNTLWCSLHAKALQTPWSVVDHLSISRSVKILAELAGGPTLYARWQGQCSLLCPPISCRHHCAATRS